MHELAVPNATPVASLTWCVAVDLPATTLETPNIPVGILQPFELLGLHAQVTRLHADDQLVAPAVADVLVRMNSRADVHLTTQIRRNQNVPAGLAQAFVPLAAMLADVRLLGLQFLDQVADLSFQFRWAFDATASPWQDDARIFLSLLVRPVSTQTEARR